MLTAHTKLRAGSARPVRRPGPWHRAAEARFGLLAAFVATVAILGAASCGPDAEAQRHLAQLDTVAAEKDSLLVQVASNALLMSEIGAELARVNAPTTSGGTETPMAVTRDSLLSNIRSLTTRLQESEARLVESEQRVAGLTGEKGGFERTIRDLRSTITNQKQTIVSMTEQVEALREENVRLSQANVVLSETNVSLSEENLALADTVSQLAERDNTVYYVIGNKDDLLRRGIVVEEGGSRVLFVFGKRGKTLVPARELDPAQFVMVDKRTFSEVPLLGDKEYVIASRQDFGALDPRPGEDGLVSGVLRIAEPDRFWAGGRYLVIVER